MLKFGEIGKHTIVLGEPVPTGIRRKPSAKRKAQVKWNKDLAFVEGLALRQERMNRVRNTGGRNQRAYTRGVYAWRVQNGTASRIEAPPLVAISELEFRELTSGGAIPSEVLRTAPYVARNARSAYDIIPRFRTSRNQEWAIYACQADGKGRPQLVRTGFRFCCEWGICYKKKGDSKQWLCASCWLTFHADNLRVNKGTMFLIREETTLDREKIEDAAGVDPKGRKARGGSANLKVDAPHFSMTSTITDYKSGSDTNVQLDPRKIKDPPATKDFRDEIDLRK